VARSTNFSRSAAIASFFFFPIARLRMSASPSEYPAIAEAICITCS
jgi:hypothetical protein